VTDLIDAVVAVVVAFAVNVFVVSRIRRAWGAESALLVKIYTWTVVLRGLLAVFLNVNAGDSAFANTFWGDSGTYDWGGWLLVQYWSGETLVNPYLERAVSGYGFYYYVASIYLFFGRNQLLVQLLNGAIGGLTVIVIYAIARMLFDAVAARWAALFTAFFPQVVFWSAGMYKDPAIILCISLCMYAVLRLRERFSARSLALFVGAALCLMTLRFYVFYFVAFAALGTFLFSQRRGLGARLAAQVVFVAAFLTAFSFAARRETVDRHTQYLNLRFVQSARQDQAERAQSGFGAQQDVSTWGGALAALPTGIVYLLFAPFPWAVTGLRQTLTVPETIVWYALMPALVRGLRYTIRHRLREALPILVFAGSLTCAYSIFQSNVGTAYRQRTQVTVFFFILMGVGLAETQRRRVEARPAAWAQPARS
jgi:4-amino-4-deoxy-L-arabinose transferase-like glycosyltransferase